MVGAIIQCIHEITYGIHKIMLPEMDGAGVSFPQDIFPEKAGDMQNSYLMHLNLFRYQMLTYKFRA